MKLDSKSATVLSLIIVFRLCKMVRFAIIGSNKTNILLQLHSLYAPLKPGPCQNAVRFFFGVPPSSPTVGRLSYSLGVVTLNVSYQ